MNKRTRIGVALALASLTLGAFPSSAAEVRSGNDTPVRASRVSEIQGVSDGGYFAWTRNSRRYPGRFNVFLKTPSGRVVKVNARGTEAFLGGISGGTLAYQQNKGRGSDIRLFDLKTLRHKRTPRGVNTRKGNEYLPSISGRHLLFGRRLRHNGWARLILFDLRDRTQRVLAKPGRGYLQPGQVNGSYVTWLSPPYGRRHALYWYNTSTREKGYVFDRQAWAPSVSSSGTIYYETTGRGCGIRPKLRRRRIFDGATRTIARLPEGVDMFHTHVYVDTDGIQKLLHERSRCNSPRFGSDVYEFVDSYELKVVKEGLGEGSVTSDPPGINCGDDCSHHYAGGSTVTLTARSEIGHHFAGWSGACSHADHECVVTVNEAMTATARFELGPP